MTPDERPGVESGRAQLDENSLPGATPGAVAAGYSVYQEGTWREVPAALVVEEFELCLYVNGQELATMAATPVDQEALGLGFLANQGLIHSLAEVREVHLSHEGSCVDIWLDHAIDPPKRKVLTSGCSGGVTFDTLVQRLSPLPDSPAMTVDDIVAGMSALHTAGTLYAKTRGIHTSILWREGRVLAAAEDVGRHNTLDKLRGHCLRRQLDPAGACLISTGRISSEMIAKAARMNCPIVVSRTSATSLSIRLAREWNITLVGYLRSHPGRQGRMIVYSHPQRILA
jgi:FdhD protein